MGFGPFLSILLELTSDLDLINCVEVASVINIVGSFFGRNGTWEQLLVDCFLKICGNEGFEKPITGSVSAALVNPRRLEHSDGKNILFSLKTSLFVGDKNILDFLWKIFVKNEVAMS